MDYDDDLAAAAVFDRPSRTLLQVDDETGFFDLIAVGYGSNFLEGKSLSWVYFVATLDAAIRGDLRP